MTEVEWLDSLDPQRLLSILGHEWWCREGQRQRNRKARLIALACCRRIQHLLNSEGQALLDHVEGIAEKMLDEEEWSNNLIRFIEGRMSEISDPFSWAVDVYQLKDSRAAAADGAVQALAHFPFCSARLDSTAVSLLAEKTMVTLGLDHAFERETGYAWAHGRFAVMEAERVCQAHLIRDIMGNPFCRSEADPSWLEWKDGTVFKLAQSIHESGCFEQVPILGDTLEEAGCTDAAILDHCHQPGEHVRGCWVVDLLLDKK